MPCRTAPVPPLAPLNKGGIEGGYDPEVQKIKNSAFRKFKKATGGLFKKLIDETDKLFICFDKNGG